MVAANTIFLDPKTVAQTNGKNVFPMIRAKANSQRGTLSTGPGGRKVMLDDNSPPTHAFLWAARRSKGKDVQFNHIWPGADSVEIYTALWNLCATPAFLAKTTDTWRDIEALLRYRSYVLYGFLPKGKAPPAKPESYDRLKWADHPDPVDDLEFVYRQAMKTKAKNRTVVAARTLGWLFSEWKPDPNLLGRPRDPVHWNSD